MHLVVVVVYVFMNETVKSVMLGAEVPPHPTRLSTPGIPVPGDRSNSSYVRPTSLKHNYIGYFSVSSPGLVLHLTFFGR